MTKKQIPGVSTRSLALAGLLAGLCLLLRGAEPAARTLVYHERRGSVVETQTYTLTREGEGFRVVLLRRTPDGRERRDECLLDGDLATLSWTFRDTRGPSELSASRQGERILLEGRFEGQPVKRSLKIDGQPWRQLFSIDFAAEAAKGVDSFGFWSVGTEGPGKLRAAEFRARSLGEEELSWNGAWVATVRYRIALKGFRSMFWHGDYWFRRADGRYLKYDGGGGFFSGRVTKELVSE